ncbi:caspase family protein [Aquimarina sp. U1-2]|uniref:caspase family protein n=1 Tax=Aquimarina sp. U1-2 TaxID=2823141 RepID=UPI001AECF4F5|nr:caspase family protein [Aquimarina sp. U1-2]MBP2833814.1 caspase family protein [Aquimarina sp. U1-2]
MINKFKDLNNFSKKHIILLLALFSSFFNTAKGQTIDFYTKLETRLNNPVKNIAISKSGKYFAISSGKKIDFYDSSSKKLINSLDTNNNQEIYDLTFTQNDSVVFISHLNKQYLNLVHNQNKESYLFNWFSSDKKKTYLNMSTIFPNNHTPYFWIIENKFRQSIINTKETNGSVLVSFNSNGKVNNSKKELYHQSVKNILSKNDKLLAISYEQGHTLIIDPISLKTFDSIPKLSKLNKNQNNPISLLEFSKDGNLLAFKYSYGNIVYIYDIIKKKIRFQYKAIENTGLITSIAFNEATLAIAQGNFIKIYEINNFKKIYEIAIQDHLPEGTIIDYINQIKFIPNSSDLIIGGYVYHNGLDRFSKSIVFNYKKHQLFKKDITVNNKIVGNEKENIRSVQTQLWHYDQLYINPKTLLTKDTFITYQGKNIKLWNKRTLRLIKNINLNYEIDKIIVNESGKFIIAITGLSQNEKIYVINLKSSKLYSISKNDVYNFESFHNEISTLNSKYLITYKNYKGGHVYNLYESRFESFFKFDFEIRDILPRAIKYNGIECNFIVSRNNEIILFDPLKNQILYKNEFKKPIENIKIDINNFIYAYSENRIFVYNSKKVNFDQVITLNRNAIIKDLNSINSNEFLVSYQDELDRKISIVSINNNREKILSNSEYVLSTGIIDKKTYFKIKKEKISFLDIQENEVLEEILISPNVKEDAILTDVLISANTKENLLLRQKYLSCNNELIDLEKCETIDIDGFSNVKFFKENLFITYNHFLETDNFSFKNSNIVCFNKDGEIIKKASTPNPEDTYYQGKFIISPNNKYGISEGLSNDLLIWDLEKFKALKHMKNKEVLEWINNDEKLIIKEKNELQIYDLIKDEYSKIHSPPSLANICFKHNDSTLLFGYQNIKEFNYTKNKTYNHTFYHPLPINKVLYSDKYDYLIVGLSNGEIFIWSFKDQKVISRLWKHTDEIIDLHIAKNKLVSSSKDQSICIWNLNNKKLLTQYYEFNSGKQKEYAFITDKNYYKTSKNISKFLHFVEGENTYPFEQFDLKYNRPDIVLNELGMSDSLLISSYKNAYYKRLEKMNFQENMLLDKWHVPEIEIVNSKDIFKEFGRITNSPNIKLELKANDSISLLNRLNIWVNDVPINGINGISLQSDKTNRLIKMIDLELSEGSNKIQASVINQNGAESNKETINIKYQPVKSKKPNLYIVGIGVSEYVNFNNLKNVDNDIRGLVSLYKSEKSDYFNKIYVDTIINSNARKEQLPRLKKFLQQSDVNDVVIVYYSGHGNFSKDKKNYYLFTHDIDAKNISDKGILYDSMEDLIDNIPARKKLLLINACKSGEYDEDLKTLEITNALFSDLRRKSGAMIISSSSSDQFSFTGSEKYKDFSAFGYSLINLLKQNKTLTVNDLQSKLSKDVSLLTRNKQKPSFRGINLEMDFRFW